MSGAGRLRSRVGRRAVVGLAALLAAVALVTVSPPGSGARADAATSSATDSSYAIVDAAGGVMTLVRLVWLALSNAFDFRRMQAEDA